jgi:7,8-dihydro-6-hydroxymethylpterin-pyrophosphokinase
MGDRVANIERACDEMDRRGIRVRRTSGLWETRPMYVEDQGMFVNGACEVGGWPKEDKSKKKHAPPSSSSSPPRPEICHS